MEHKRAAVGNETTVEEHFEGMWGLRAEFMDAGIMDAEGFILDSRRVLNRDECPQFVNYNSNKGNMKTKTAAFYSVFDLVLVFRMIVHRPERATWLSATSRRTASATPWT
jgi:hypothetical protein